MKREVEWVGFVKRFLRRLIGPTRPPGRTLTPRQSGELVLQRPAHRSLNLFDFHEMSPAQKAAVVLSSLPQSLASSVYEKLGPMCRHKITKEQQLLRHLEPALRSVILSEYLGLPHSGTEGLKALEKCLEAYASKEMDSLAKEIEALLAADQETAELNGLGELFFYQDFLHHHKVAVVLWLTNTLDDPDLEEYLGPRGSVFVDTARPVLPLLKMMTKLRVVREFLEISQDPSPEPTVEKEFARLTLALNTVRASDRVKFLETVRDTWPHLVVNPLIVRMFERRERAKCPGA